MPLDPFGVRVVAADGGAARTTVPLRHACRGLIVIGSPETLRSDRVWSLWLDWVYEHDAVRALPAEPSHLKDHAAELPDVAEL